MKNNNFLLLKKWKNTASAQLWLPQYRRQHKTFSSTVPTAHLGLKIQSWALSVFLAIYH